MTNPTANGSKTDKMQRARMLAVLLLPAFVLAACATVPERPEGATEARIKLGELQRDPNLSDRARVEIREAEEAVRVAERPVSAEDAELGRHRVYMADRMVEIASAKASTRLAEDQRERLAERRDQFRLQARTQEADRAQGAADRAQADAEDARSDAAGVSAELQRQIDVLEAKATERGVVLTLGDVLFATGDANLRGGDANLRRLVDFLNQYPDRRVVIEGHTDDVGSAALNLRLSERRAESIRDYLVQQGIVSRRLSVSGVGMERPIASNDSATGRQQNRRVEIIIENPPQTTTPPVGARR